MVYCKFKTKTSDTVTYLYGETIDDMSGELVFLFKEDAINVAREPDKYPVLERQIHSLYGMHRDEFRSGIFKDKIAYEA